jgi:hypothetical protein
MDIKGIIPLDAESLISTAMRNTGLDYFGEDDWYEPFKLLVKGFDEESELNLMGRIMTRSDMLMFLQARLHIEEVFRKHPEVAEQEIKKPVMIIGQGRSGTSVLHNVLSKDPDNAVIKTWEVYFPYPPPETATYATDPRINRADKLATQIARVTPEIASMHEFYGDVPTDCAFAHCLTFNSPAWFGPIQGQSPTYVSEVIKRSVVPVYQYEKKLLQLLQWKNPRKRWVLKSPYSINHIPEILQVFPDMGFIWPHRDPVKALASMVNILGITFWARSDHPFIGGTMAMYTNADIGAGMMSRAIDWLESGVLPKDQLYNIKYQTFVETPLEVVASIYEYFGFALTEHGHHAMRQYMLDSPRAKRPAHRYDVGDPELIKNERKAYQRYQDYFDVPCEV